MKFRYLALSSIILLVSFSCNKDDDTITNLVENGNITGAVNLYTEGTTQIENSNMVVKIDGITPTISATTKADGNFTIPDVPFGTHIITYEKPGFGTFKKFDIEHENSTTAILNSPSLGEISTTQIINVQTGIVDDDIVISITTEPAGSLGSTRYIRYFLSTNSNVNNEDYSNFSPGLVSQINPKEISLSKTDLLDAGFSSGDVIFIKVYGDSFWSNTYHDPNLGRDVFPNLNMSSVDPVSFIVP